MEKRYSTVLSIAGSDSIGGAGIQADIKTCSALGAYAMTAITAVTAQNTTGVVSFEAVSPSLLAAQLQAVGEDVRPDAVKIGMIPDKAHAEIIAQAIRQFGWRNVVVDPVMVASSGDALSTDSSVRAVMKLLFPLSDILTPNLPEAEKITGSRISTPHEMIAVARAIINDFGPKAVLMKGGHMADTDSLTDIFVDNQGTVRTYSHKRVDTVNSHGTGCSLSSAIASQLARGFGMSEAVSRGIEWLSFAIEAGKDYEFGHGHGPVCFCVGHDLND